ncbi:MAG TPA: PDZ domain-containing protein [Terriglobales bacterium]|nr:PDZ domain-containing protein [Terriglobales bacterium]
MIPPDRVKLTLFLVVAVLSSTASAQKSEGLTSAVHYTVSLAHAADHLVKVDIELAPGSAQRDLQLPVWNALYQVRDFAQYVNWVKAQNPTGKTLVFRPLDKTTWRISGADHGARIEYEILADQPGPYGAQLSSAHAFFNLAEILMYPVGQRGVEMAVRFTDIPANWQIATALTPAGPAEFRAANYDQLVDSPVEIGTFKDAWLQVGGAQYRVVVDASPSDYNMQTIVSMVKKIVTAASTWMDDRPFDHYLFLYHFPRGPGGGGMEHAYSTAIELNARALTANPEYLPDVTAHEFFHLWNVKRIRPQSLEPVDYTRENYTPSLWFSEGVTSTVGPYILLRAGLLDQSRYVKDLAEQITALQRRPAHLAQSAEESSLDAWLEKYPYYRLPQRSISYYNKGELLGVMLDLELREASHGAASLRDLFHWMNDHYAKQGRFFPDADGIRQAAEAVSHTDLGWFFQKYVAATEEIPYDDFFKTVGLRLVRGTIVVADPGFIPVRNFGAPQSVGTVISGGEAEAAGLSVGDSILEINGQPANSDLEEQIANLRPGDNVHLTVRSVSGQRELSWTLGSREEVEFELKDLDNITPEQRARRVAWLAGEDQKPGDAHP